MLRFLVGIRNLGKYEKIAWNKFIKNKKIFQKAFCSMQNFLKCLVNDVVGFLEGSMFIDASIPNIHIFFSKQQQAEIGEKLSKS